MSSLLSWGDFAKVEMRVGTIIDAALFQEAIKPAIKVTVDFGEWGIKQSAAQITTLYDPEDIIGRQVVAVTNFKPKQIANLMSECLLLGAIGEGSEVVLLEPERKVPNGSRIG